MPTSLPPAAPIAVSTPDLSVELDELLIEYLASLDVYQARQSRLATQLKSVRPPLPYPRARAR
jgi:hypothetical protein